MTCTRPGFFSGLTVGSMGINFGRQFLVMGNLIFCDCGLLDVFPGNLLACCSEISPGGLDFGAGTVVTVAVTEGGCGGGVGVAMIG